MSKLLLITSDQHHGIRKAAEKIATMVPHVTVNQVKDALGLSIHHSNSFGNFTPILMERKLRKSATPEPDVTVEYFNLGNTEGVRLVLDDDPPIYLPFNGERT